MSLPNSTSQNPYSYDGAAAPTRSGILPDDTVYWIPTEGATLHNGKPIPSRMDFPFLPPPELGEVYTASSELRGALMALLWHDFKEMAGRVTAAIFFAIYFGLQFVRLLATLVHARSILFGIMAVIFVGVLLFDITRRRRLAVYRKSMGSKMRLPQCSYVCEFGFVQWFRSDEGYRAEVQTFDRFTHSIYQGQELEKMATESVQAVLVNPRGEHVICLLSGSLLPVFDHFEFSILIAWTKFVLRRVRRELENGGHFDFHTKANLIFRFWTDRVEILSGAGIIRINKGDIVLFRFTFDQKLKFFVRAHLSPANRGEFVLHLFDFPDFAAFCILAETILGIKMEGRKVDFLPKWHHGGW